MSYSPTVVLTSMTLSQLPKVYDPTKSFRRLEGEAQTGDLGDEGGINHEDVRGRHLKRHGACEAAVVLGRVAALDVGVESIFGATVQFAARELEGLPQRIWSCQSIYESYTI